MVIEHIAMYVNDLERAGDFFIKYLGGRSNDRYHNKNDYVAKSREIPTPAAKQCLLLDN